MADGEDRGATPDQRIVEEAKKRFQRCSDWESIARVRFKDDVKFCNGDADNLWQWPSEVRNARVTEQDQRPCLTINKTRQHCLQIINDARQNKTSIKVIPTGGNATREAAEVLEGIVRHIEYISDAQAAYGTATRFQVQGGIGYWRVVTDYAGDDTFDQEIFIRRIKDPLCVYIDPDIQEANGSDMRFAFVFDDMPRDEFKKAYPKVNPADASLPGAETDAWVGQDHVRVAEYFRRSEKTDRLIVFPDGMVQRYSKIPRELRKLVDEAVVDDPRYKSREIKESQVEWFLIAGDKVIERREWPGRYIPIVRVPGEETVIDGEMDRKGHTRALKDPQRMYNYNCSAEVEFVALQNKIPYVGPVKAFEGQEAYWKSANNNNYAYIGYNHVDDEGQPIPPPQRQQAPLAAPGYLQGMQTAATDMMMVSGQYEAEFGQKSNERSGVAIQQRQRAGDNATYHFIDHLAMAIRFTGKIIIDLIPKIYDTPRVIKIMAEDGSDSEVQIDPKAPEAFAKTKPASRDTAEQVIMNPNVGRYEVMADVGPAFATRRQEAFAALTQVAAQNKEFLNVAGDVLWEVADFPKANVLAERFRRLIPPNILGEGPEPAIAELQQKLEAAQGIIQQLAQKMEDKSTGHELEQQQKLIDSFKAQTDRVEIFLEAMAAYFPEGLRALTIDTAQDALDINLTAGLSGGAAA